MSTVPDPTTLTLRLKYHKTTILLHVSQLATLSQLKAELFHALQETCPRGFPLLGPDPDTVEEYKPLPTSADEIVFGLPKNIVDPHGGWKRIAAPAILSEDENGKGKKAQTSVEETVKGAGIKDGMALAFKWGDEATLQSGGDEAMVMDGEEDVLEEEEWDVVIPRYEDVYGVENIGDVGARSEYVG